MTGDRTKESIEAEWKEQELKRVRDLDPLYEEWAKRDTWNLKHEAAPLLYGISPDFLRTMPTVFPVEGNPAPGTTKSRDDFVAEAIRAAAAFRLPIATDSHDENHIAVLPERFAAYLLNYGIPHHPALVDSVRRLRPIPRPESAAITEHRHRIRQSLEHILDAGYPFERFEAALAATAALWLQYEPATGLHRPTESMVKDWIIRQFPRLTEAEAKTIDVLIRRPGVLGGNRKTAKLKSN